MAPLPRAFQTSSLTLTLLSAGAPVVACRGVFPSGCLTGLHPKFGRRTKDALQQLFCTCHIQSLHLVE